MNDWLIGGLPVIGLTPDHRLIGSRRTALISGRLRLLSMVQLMRRIATPAVCDVASCRHSDDAGEITSTISHLTA